MSGQTLFGRLFPLLFGLMAFSLGVMVMPLSEQANRNLRKEARHALRQEGDLLRELAVDPIIDRHPRSLGAVCGRVVTHGFLGVSIVAADGARLCAAGDVGLAEKEIESALAGAPVWREDDRLAIALPIVSEGRVIGAVALSRVNPEGAFGGFFFWGILLSLAAGGGALVAWRTRAVVIDGLDRLNQGAARFALARFDQKVYGGAIDEFANAAASLNRMGAALADRLSDADETDRGAVAILASMKEGVIAVDADGCVIRINPALRRILSIRTDVAPSTPLTDILPNGDLLRFLTDALSSPSSLEREVIYEHGATPRNLQLVITPLILDKGSSAASWPPSATSPI